MKHTTSFILNKTLDKEAELLNLLQNYFISLKEAPSSFLNELAVFSSLSTDVSAIEKLLNDMKSLEYENIILLGIGGSSLGTLAYYSAFKNEGKYKKLYVLDTLDEKDLNKVLSETKPENSLVLFVSKSGHTLETLTNFEILQDNGYIIKERLISILSESSTLFPKMQEVSRATFTISEHLSGRYSFFSYVGLVPLALLGFSVSKITKSAQKHLKAYLDLGKESEPALSALALFQFANEGRRIYNYFYMDKSLQNLAMWYRQLYSESVGKEGNKNPLYFSINNSTTDFHSVLQMYFSNPKDQVFGFLGIDNPSSLKITAPLVSEFLDTQQVNFVKNSLNVSVAKAADALSIPCSETLIKKTEEEFVNFMVYKILEVMLYGKLLGINSFNQPNIESYKKHALDLIKKN